MTTEELTLTLAIWGAVTGSLGGLVAAVNFVRDRPRVRVGAVSHQRGSTREYVFTVVNEGRRPVVIVDCGVALAVDTLGRWPRRRSVLTAITAYPEDGQLPRRLDAWDPMSWRHTPPSGESVRLEQTYVKDSSGRVTWLGSALPVD